MHDMILSIVNQYGYFGVFFLIAIENIFPPIPSEIILTFGGFMTTHTDMNIWGVIFAATAGSVLGAVILYAVGRIIHTERLERLFDSRLGRLLRLKKGDVRRAGGWFVRHGKRAIFFCRFVPIVRSLISVPAGAAKIRLKVFLPLTVLGTLIWNVVLVFLGRIAGEAWEKIAEYADIYTLAALALFAVAAVIIGAIFVKRRFLGRGARRDL